MQENKNTNAFAVEAIWPTWHTEIWVSYTLKAVTEGMASDQLAAGITCMAKARSVLHPYVHPVMHTYIYKFLERHIKDAFSIVSSAALARLQKGDVAYFWIGCPLEQTARFHDKGIMVAREMINCTLQLRRKELRRAYELLGLPDGSQISDQDIEKERAELLAMDVIFCPNPQVKRSVLDYGFPAEKCIDTSYGWSQSRLGSETVAVPRDGTFTAAFVGTMDVRKGVPWLLEAWSKAGIKGRLLLAGRASPEFMSTYAQLLNRPDVVLLGHVDDVGSVYRSADVFCMPTWEEGGPLVTLEAMAAGCVPVVTPMGTAGAFEADDGIGIVFASGDTEAISAGLRLLAGNPELCASYSAKAKARSLQYSWDKVGALRRSELTRLRANWLAASQ